MLNHTKKIKDIYEDIQRKLFYMIPEKWDALYLYSSVIDISEKEKTGELFFYYIPKGIFRKNPVNVYEIPNKFNIDEEQYLQLVEILYNEIKELREEFKKQNIEKIWSNITISIYNMQFKVEYKYDDLKNDEFSSYERHVIWRYKYLEIGIEQVSKQDKEILQKYFLMPRTLEEKEEYNSGIYIEQDTKNIIEYNTEEENQDEYEYNFEEKHESPYIIETVKKEKKYNQFTSTKIENAWDNRKKRKTKKPLQVNIREFQNSLKEQLKKEEPRKAMGVKEAVESIDIENILEKTVQDNHERKNFNQILNQNVDSKERKNTSKKRNQILFSEDELDNN